MKATITIYGDKLKKRDLEFLQVKVGDLRKGFEEEEAPQVAFEPKQAVWKNKDHDLPVTIIGETG